ncbi:MAG: hypothetical protein ACD_34C00525G0002 [uncultured bacterium]|nr:MAG: hypothetical protein ACD_34C00525G0002 [uncultured bacterium]HCS38047.1 DtxR family transcriptional regulator [Anaerolineaceae bacterium]
MRSQSNEDFIKTIYLIQENQQGHSVSTSSLAAHLGIANASVTGMLKKIASEDPKLINYEPYRGVILTKTGEKIALEIIRHHRLLETYLSEKLGYSWDEVHDEADRLEHVISEEMEERIANSLGNPIVDPHGDPIPDREGNFHQPTFVLLSEIPVGHPVEICRVIGQEPDLLRYLAESGLILSSQIIVTIKAPFSGPITIRLMGSQEPQIALSREIADKIFVMPKANTVLEVSYEQ